MRTRVAIAGQMGSGKTTASKYLQQIWGFQSLGFATPLYELAALHQRDERLWRDNIVAWLGRWETYRILDPIQELDFIDGALGAFQQVPRTEGKNRRLLQLLGTDVGRAIKETMWTELFAAGVENLGPEARVVNDNLRFPNEMECVQALGFLTIYIEAPEEVVAARYEKEYGHPPTQDQLSHPSETEIPKLKEMADLVLHNDSSLFAFLSTVDVVVSSFEPAQTVW